MSELGRPGLPADSDLPALALSVARAGGRLLAVGGFVRDALIAKPSHDVDLEVFGLEIEAVEAAIAGFGFSQRVGRHRPVWRRVRDGVDLAYPRGEQAGAATTRTALEAAFREAGRDRDLTCNAIGWDLLDDSFVDPWDGRRDLADRRLAAVDVATFGRDPLRLLRVARFRAVLRAEVDPALVALCQALDLHGVAVERIGGELLRLLVDLPAPSQAFAWLDSIGRLDVFAPIAALKGVPQDPVWHPEGDVLVHTLLVLDRARELAEALDAESRASLMLAALCHDLGKPATTTREGERVRSIGHEAASARETRAWLTRLRFPERIVQAVEGLVLLHLAPVALVRGGAGASAYRRLARRAADFGCTLAQLERIARADQLGRTTDDALAGRFAAGDAFLAAAEDSSVRDAPAGDVVRARDLLRRGIPAGPELGRLLRRCREIEDETGWRDPERVIAHCLANPGARGDDAVD